MLYHGSEKMLQQEKTEFNTVNELINALLELYLKEKTLVTKETSGTVIDMQVNCSNC